jgi:hypothetical protein
MPFTPDEIIISGKNARDEVSVISEYTYEVFYIDGDNLVPDAVDGGVFEYDGPHRIVFTYGKLTTSYDFDVTREGIVELYMVNEPNRVTYELGEPLDTSGMELRALYNTGVVTDVTDYEISGFDSNNVGECCITIGCGGCSIDYTVEILDCLWLYVTHDNEITLLRYLGRDRVVNIPSAINGYPVTEIGACALYGNTCIRTANIPDTVKIIG